MSTFDMPADIAADLEQQSKAANECLARGDFDSYLAAIRSTPDCVLMGPFGGKPLRGYDTSAAGRARMAGMFRNGTFRQEVVSSHVSDGLAVLVTVERLAGEIAGQPAQDWALRVTQVFRREAGQWHLVHRHADPLANGVPPAKGAALARGEAC